MFQLIPYLKGYKKESVIGPLFKLLEACFELIVPLVMAKIIDVGIENRDMPYILKMGGVLILLGVIGLACSLTAQYFAAKAAVGFGTELRHDLFRHISTLSYQEIDQVGSATLVTRMTSDINQVQSGVNLVLRLFLRSPFIVVGAVVMAFTVNFRLAWIFVVAVPLLSIVIYGIMMITIPIYKKVQKGLDQILLTTRENLAGIRVIRAFRTQKEEQKAFEKCQDVVLEYPVAENEGEEDNTYLSYNKVIGTSLDEKLYLAFQILDYALLSAPGAPLKKALLDAGIGKDIMGSYDNGIYQPIFSIVSKNANRDQKEAFIRVIEETLQSIVKNGMDKKSLEAGINYHEFRFREADFGNYPKGLMYGLQIMDSWLYDENEPFMHMQAIPTFEYLKEQISTGYFEKLIQTYLLDNQHGSIVIVKPEKGRTARMDKELEEKLAAYKAGLSEEELNRLVAATKELEAYQESEDAPEDMAKIPVLNREDITEEIAPVYNTEKEIDGIKLVHHEIESNGIGYATLMFDLSGVSEELLPYTGILQSVLGIIDTNNYGYGELFNEINVHTGGIGTSLELYPDVTKAKEKDFRATFEIKGKALYPQMKILFAMMREILMESRLDDEKRLKEILAMLKSRLQMSFQSSGHTTSALRALSYGSPLSKFKDDTDGIGFYEVVRGIEEHFEEKKAELIQNLKQLSRQIFRVDNVMISYTSSEDGLTPIEAAFREIKDTLYPELDGEETPCVLHCRKRNEGFKTSSKVQYVARVGNFIDHGAQYHGALQILKVILSYDYLWQNVRVKGGAYGCMSNFNRIGEGYLISYRDPNLKKTMEVYEGVVDYLKNFTVDERDMTKYIIGTISNIDRPMNPAAKGDRSMNLYMNHVSQEMIRTERSQILHAAQEDIRALAAVVEAMLKAEQICVIGSEEKIEEEKEMFLEVKTLF